MTVSLRHLTFVVIDSVLRTAVASTTEEIQKRTERRTQQYRNKEEREFSNVAREPPAAGTRDSKKGKRAQRGIQQPYMVLAVQDHPLINA